MRVLDWKREQADALAAVAQRQYEQACAPVLAGLRIADHRARCRSRLALLRQVRVTMTAQASGDCAPRSLRTKRLTLS